MISYTLVIIMAIYPYDYRASGSSSMLQVTGFTTEQACKNAEAKLKIPQPTTKYVSQSVKTSCVAMTI